MRLLYGISLLAVLGLGSLKIAEAQDNKLDQMISPITHPVTFEDPRSNSELRAIYAHHEIDDDFATNGGDVNIFALQARFAVDEQLAIIATKDGYVDFNPNDTLAKDEGWANIGLGAKYAFLYDPSAGEIVTGGLRYEWAMGDEEVLQGNGDGIFNPFVSAAWALDTVNLMLGTGFRVPVDGDDSTFYDLDVHLDYPINNFYPTIELGLNHVVDAGRRLAIADEGQDFFNIGSSESEGKTLVTFAVGTRYRINDTVDLGVAYQVPLTNGAGSRIIDYRVTTDLIYSF